ncbi:MAG: LamG-like jellyroll fold domain-containing protein [Gaiellales bacterium]
MADSPVAYWRLGESSGSVAVDSSGHGNDSTYFNGVTLGAPGALQGSTDTSASFDGIDDRVNRAPVTTQTSNVSLEAWVYYGGCCNNTSTGAGPVVLYNGHSGANGFGLLYSSGGGWACGAAAQLYVLLGGITCNGDGPGGVLPANQWAYLVVTHSAGNVWRIYVNGVKTAEATGQPAPNAITSGGTAIGDEFDGTGGSGQFQGRIDEVAVYNTALTPAQIAAHFAAGGGQITQPIEQTYGGCGDLENGEAACELMSDPVNTLTGAFTHAETDLSLASTGLGYQLTRSYTSADSTVTRFGPGWTDNYSVSLSVQPGGDVKLRGGEGQILMYTLTASGAFDGGPGARSKLESIAGGYRLTRHDQAVYTFDSQGRVTSQVDRNGVGVTVAYDGSGRLSTVTDSAGHTATYGYAGAGTLVTGVTLSDGRSVSYGYTSGRLTSFTDVRGKGWTYTYDGGGRLATIVDPLSHTQVTNVYDPTSGRVTSQTDATNKTTTFAWDAPTQTATVTDPNNHVWKDVYVNNVLSSRIDGANNTTQLGHDADLNGDSVTGPTGETTTMSFDASGNMLSATAPPSLGGVSKTFTYNANNDPLTVTDARGKVTSYTYTGGNVDTVTQDGVQVAGYTYDGQGRVATSTDGNGKTTTYSYDANGNVASVTAPDPDGAGPSASPVTTFTYDSQGNVLTRVDPKGNVSGCGCAAQYTTTFTYNLAGQQLTETDPLGHVTTNVYDDAGRLSSSTDANSHTTSYTYDNANRVLTETQPDPDGAGALTSPVTTYTYDNAGNKLTETDPRGNTTTFAYDNANRLVSTTGPDPDGAGPLPAPVTTNTYDSNGNLASTVEPRGNVSGANPDDYKTTYTYDAAGRVLTTTAPDPDGAGSQVAATTTNTYDNVGNLATVTDGNGHVTSYTYDAQGRILTVTAPDPDGAGALTAPVTTYTYDPVGNQLTKTDAKGHTTTTAYDGLNRVTSVTGPDPDGAGALTSSVTSYTYDPNGNQLTVTDANGNNTPAAGDGTTTFAYDRANRQTGIDYSDTTPDVTFTLDNVGNRLSMTDGISGAQTRTYDNLDRLLTVTRGTSTFTYVYDAAGNLTKRTYPDGTVVNLTYDPLGRMASAGTTSFNTSYAYDVASNLTTTTLPSGNGYVETRLYDRAGRLNEVKNVKGASTLADITYVRDPVGNPLTETRTGASAVSKTFQYDNMDRLTGVCFLATTCPNATDPYIRWTYDGVGNRLTEARPSVATTTYTYDNMDRMLTAGATAYTYDRNGNELSAGTRSFTYDLANRMKTTVSGSTTTTYTYDGDSVRTQASTGTTAASKTNFIWDINNNLPMLARESNGSGTLQRRYVYGQRLIYMSTTASNAWFYHYDPLGSVRNVTSQTGATQLTYDYEPYGTVRTSTGTSPTNFLKFTGEYNDPTGLYHLRARQYDPAVGRLLATDPVVSGSGDPASSPYVYAGDRPAVMIDPGGKTFEVAEEYRVAARTSASIAEVGAISIPGPTQYSYTFGLGSRGSPSVLLRFTHRNCELVFPLAGCRNNFASGMKLDLHLDLPFLPDPHFPVRVTAIGETRFSFVSLPGHPEGTGRGITFRFIRQGNANYLNVATSGDGSAVTKPPASYVNNWIAKQTWDLLAGQIRIAFYVFTTGKWPE